MIRAAILAIAILAAGCASLATPQSIDQSLAYAHGTATATAQTCADLITRGRMTQAQGERCAELVDQAERAIDLGRGAADAATAQTQLELALSILRQLETMTREAQR